MTNGKTDGARFLDQALEGVESESIRAWANTDNNRPIFEKIAQNALDKAEAEGREADVDRFTAYVVCLAIGA